MTRNARRGVWPLAIAACAIAGVFAISRLWSSHSSAVEMDEIRWGYAALALFLYGGFVLTYATCWWTLVRALQSRHVSAAGAMRLFLLAWPGRYVPGSVAYYGGRLVSAPSIGVSRSALAASLVYENVFAIAASGILSVLLLAASFRRDLDMGIWVVAALAAAVFAVASLHPAVARAVIRIAARRISRLRPLEERVLSSGQIVRIGSLYMLGSLLCGLAYFAALRAFSIHPPLLLAVAAYNLGGIAGMLALFVPGGVGVREGVAVSVLSIAVAAPGALGAAVLLRLLTVVADLALPAAVLALSFAARFLRPPRLALAPAVEEERVA